MQKGKGGGGEGGGKEDPNVPMSARCAGCGGPAEGKGKRGGGKKKGSARERQRSSFTGLGVLTA